MRFHHSSRRIPYPVLAMNCDWKAGELSLTYTRTEPDGDTIRKPTDCVSRFRAAMGPDIEIRETAYIMGLSRSNQLRTFFKLSDGSVSGCMIDPRLIFSRLLLDHAQAFVLAHNHPSGNCAPSLADKKLTKTIYRASESLDIPLLDHIIVTTDSFYSFADSDPHSLSS